MAAFYAVNISVATTEDLRQVFALSDQEGAPIDLTGATLHMSVQREGEGEAALELSMANGRIMLVDAAGGTFELNVPAAVLGGLTPRYYRHDLLLVEPDRRTRIWEGGLHLVEGYAA